MPFDTIYSFLPDTCSSLQYHRCHVTHPLFIQFEQGVPHLGGVWGQAKAVLVQLGHDELQQPLGSQASGGRVSSRRGHRLLQDGTSQSLHLRTGFTLNTSGRINFTQKRRSVLLLPLWCEIWFYSCSERRWILLSPLDGSWWPPARGVRQFQKNSDVLRRQDRQINTERNETGRPTVGQTTIRAPIRLIRTCTKIITEGRWGGFI